MIKLKIILIIKFKNKIYFWIITKNKNIIKNINKHIGIMIILIIFIKLLIENKIYTKNKLSYIKTATI
jgi:hypothetical protein